MQNSENIIEREIQINAPMTKVFKALTNAQSFAQWFGVHLDSEFKEGKTTTGKNQLKGFEMDMNFHIKEIKPQHYFSYAWTPFPLDKTIDYSLEEPTLVEFFLEENPIGTLLKVRESGFNLITASRRAKAIEMHSMGWVAQLENIDKFLAR